VFECNGQFNRPCVFRCEEDYACWLQGVVEIRASETWLWGMKISDLYVGQFRFCLTSCSEGVSNSLCPITIGSSPPSFFVHVHIINNLIYSASAPGGPQRYGMCFTNDIATVIYGNIGKSLTKFWTYAP